MNGLWFTARRYGWGWTPATTEGWVVVLIFIAAVGIVTVGFLRQLHSGADRGPATLRFLVVIAILTGLLVAVAWLTGERPRWRWGE
jgi:hypothetical protein